MSDSLRVGLVGYGASGRGQHAHLLREVGQRITHVVERDPSRAAAARTDWPGVVIDPDVATMLARAAELDLVVVASPTGSHMANVNAALEARLPVVVDKPIATSTHDARALARTAEAHSGRLTVFQNRRWDAEQLTLRQVLDSGELGNVHTFERRWERWRPVPQQRWKELDVVAGGLLLDLGSHLVDSAVQLFGPVVSVYAELRSLTTPVDDDVFLALHHAAGPNGVQVHSHLQTGALVGAPGPRTRVLGDAGAYLVTSFEAEPTPFSVVDDVPHTKRDHAHVTHEGWIVRGSERVPVSRAPGGPSDFYRAVVRWLTVGGPVPVNPWDAVRTAAVLDAARESSREHRVVTLR
ncbi:Gfo/Idh/MocA family oxidoreductase [Cellulomonas sp. WB94]|uniref:Gfo/Idh/MocA family protein n=1 Tax=Cellulomonas sp. WB94 TaxID=2173174 RepID=UPI001F5B8632|nr:Gfo/Idh/MocA family oxidoreductase [Cellulomonas sp. WB94]